MASFLPTITVVLCWVVYYSKGHNTPGLLRTISETVIKFPENRIFSTLLHIESVFLVCVYYIRTKIAEIIIIRKNISTNKIKYMIYFMYTIIPFMVLGLSLLSGVTLKDHKILHLFGAQMFFILNILFFLCCDHLSLCAGYKVGIFPRLITKVIPITLLFYWIIITFFGKPRLWRSIGAIFQYISCLLIFIKIGFLESGLPQYLITSKKLNESAISMEEEEEFSEINS